MEPLFDKLARQPAVRNFFATIRNWDKRSNDWMNSISPEWRVAATSMVILILVLLLLLAAIGGFEMMMMTILLLWALGYLFLLPNLCLIVCLRRGSRFRLFHLGIFLVCLVPIAVQFLHSELIEKFDLVVLLFPTAVVFQFIYLTFSWQTLRPHRAWKIVKFAAALLIMTAICSIIWDNHVAGHLYNDSDDNSFGFLFPGAWVSNWDGQHPVVSVDHIVPESSMSDPDEIKKGWSVAELWGLWLSFAGFSVIISIVLAWLPWIPRRLKHSLSATA